MCGVVGIVGKSDVNLQLYDALTMLQHRGQDAAGIVTCDDGRIAQQKANGLMILKQQALARNSCLNRSS